MSTAPFRIVLAFRDAPYPRLLLRLLHERGVPLAGVLVEVRAALRDCFHAAGWRRGPELPVAVARAAVRRLRTLRVREYQELAATRTLVPALGGGAAHRALEALRPDLVVLAGCGILPGSFLRIARLGVLNGHPALLPWARGNGAIAHSLLRGIPPGATVHRVDEGIDTGGVVRRRLLRVTGDETSFGQLEGAAGRLTAELTADVVAEAWRTGRMPEGVAQERRFPLCRTAGPELRPRLDEAVRRGDARALFEAWAPLCADAERLELPARDEGLPRPDGAAAGAG